MRDPVERDPPGLADDPDEDTAELVLSPQALQSLSRAADEARSAPLPGDVGNVPSCASPAHSKSGVRAAREFLKLRWPRVPFEVATVVAAFAIALASGIHRSANTPAVKTADHRVAVATSPSSNEDAASEAEGEPVRIRNPFDASEVFEFPPGTSEAVARKAVADLLLERGRARLERPIATRGGRSHRAERWSARSGESDVAAPGQQTR